MYASEWTQMVRVSKAWNTAGKNSDCLSPNFRLIAVQQPTMYEGWQSCPTVERIRGIEIKGLSPEHDAFLQGTPHVEHIQMSRPERWGYTKDNPFAYITTLDGLTTLYLENFHWYHDYEMQTAEWKTDRLGNHECIRTSSHFLAVVAESKSVEELIIAGDPTGRDVTQALEIEILAHMLGPMPKLEYLNIRYLPVDLEALINECIRPNNCWNFLELKEVALYSCFGFERKEVRELQQEAADMGYDMTTSFFPEEEATIVKIKPHRYHELHNKPEWGTYQRTNTTFYECGHTNKDNTTLRCKIDGPGPVTNECTKAECAKRGRDELKEHRDKEPHFPRTCIMTVDPTSPWDISEGPIDKDKKYHYRTTTFYVCQHGWVRIGNHEVQCMSRLSRHVHCYEDECQAMAQAWSNTEEGKHCLD
jgi:hypothetical protein